MSIRVKSAFVLSLGVVALAVGCGKNSKATDSTALETASGDYESEDARINFAWIVSDPDPAGLNCRGGTPFGEGKDIASFPVSSAKFKKGDILLSSQRFTLDNRGRPWLFVAYDASGCFIRANKGFVVPAPLPMDYPVGFRKLFKDTSTNFSWSISSEDGVNCRKGPGTSFDIVRSYTKGATLGDIEAERAWNPTFKFDEKRPELATNLITEPVVADGKSWFKVWMAAKGPITDEANICYVRASRNFLRPVR